MHPQRSSGFVTALALRRPVTVHLRLGLEPPSSPPDLNFETAVPSLVFCDTLSRYGPFCGYADEGGACPAHDDDLESYPCTDARGRREGPPVHMARCEDCQDGLHVRLRVVQCLCVWLYTASLENDADKPLV